MRVVPCITKHFCTIWRGNACRALHHETKGTASRRPPATTPCKGKIFTVQHQPCDTATGVCSCLCEQHSDCTKALSNSSVTPLSLINAPYCTWHSHNHPQRNFG